jgi:hypothetical protein
MLHIGFCGGTLVPQWGALLELGDACSGQCHQWGATVADKAFLSGVNDYKTIGDLRGCVNDTESIKRLLIAEFQFAKDQIRVRTDDDVTKSELTKGWKWLLKDTKPGDRLVFHFSGHGSQTVDRDSDESDRADELLCLYGMDWNDPKTYLLDDELKKWTKQIPDGVSVTFLLDCCHSGTGTRYIEPNLSRAMETDFRSAASLSIDRVAEQRVRDKQVGEIGGTRAAFAGDELSSRAGMRPAIATDIGEDTVLARYAPPPPAVQVEINKAKQRSSFRDVLQTTRSRSADDASMNHVLWSGCRDDQTSADAFINGDYHGAFTFYFCDSVRREGSHASSAKVVGRLRQTLRDERFDQVPQLEPSGTAGAVFGTSIESPPGTENPPTDDLAPTAFQWQQLLSSLQQLVAHLSDGGRGGGSGLRTSGRSLVYVHGICRHDAGYSDGWWAAMAPHLAPGLRQTLGNDRHEVLWSEHVTRVDRAVEEAADAVQRQQVEQMLQAILQERVTREADEQIVARGAALGRAATGASGVRAVQPEGPLPRAVLGIPGLNCVDDFVKYLTTDSIRRDVIGEFTEKIRPLLRRGDSVEVISHSWGTVVAYEALRTLDRSGLPGRVHNWFTVGAALAISYIAQQLRPSDGQKPTLVENWVNLDARGDAVGGSLQATGLRVDREYLRLPPVGCDDFFGIVSPACAHSCYFESGNVAVNRDIFAEWIERT